MQFCQFGNLFGTCFPQTFTGTFEHDGSHFFKRCGTLCFEKFFHVQVVFVFYVYIVNVVPKLFVDGGRFHYVPAICIGDCLGKFRSRGRAAFHLLFDVSGVEDGGTAFYTDSLFDFLHAHVVTVAIIAQVSIGIFAGHVAYGQVHTSHKLVDMVEAQRAPCIALTRLNHYVRTGQCGFEGIFPEGFPVLFTAIVSTHVIKIGGSYL